MSLRSRVKEDVIGLMSATGEAVSCKLRLMSCQRID
jgi:hypothetical protein